MGLLVWIMLNTLFISKEHQLIVSPAGQADLMPVKRIPTILDDDIGMRFKDRHHFLLGRHGFSQHNPPFCLPDRLLQQPRIVYDGFVQGKRPRIRGADRNGSKRPAAVLNSWLWGGSIMWAARGICFCHFSRILCVAPFSFM